MKFVFEKKLSAYAWKKNAVKECLDPNNPKNNYKPPVWQKTPTSQMLANKEFQVSQQQKCFYLLTVKIFKVPDNVLSF